jgi:ABC-type nitrate/sulfonate/bicarbonate transport system substrate-binding protein
LRSHLLLTPSLAPELVKGLEAHKRFLLDHGFIKEDFELEGWLERGPLQRLGIE